MARLVQILVLLLLAVACEKEGPAAPTPAVAATGIQLNTSDDWVFLGTPETWTATATLSDGTQESATGGMWRVDNASRASASAGTVTGLTSGLAVVLVDYKGATGSRRVRVIPNYQGAWIGSYVITSCTATGAFQTADACAALFTVGSRFPLRFQFTQLNDIVSGTADQGQFTSNSLSVPVELDGSLTLLTTAAIDTLTYTNFWNLQSATPGQITGSVVWTVRDSKLSGDARLTANLIDTNRE